MLTTIIDLIEHFTYENILPSINKFPTKSIYAKTCPGVELIPQNHLNSFARKCKGAREACEWFSCFADRNN